MFKPHWRNVDQCGFSVVLHRRRKVYNIGGPRFRILGGPRGAKFPEAHDVVMTSMRRNDVASTSFRRHVPKRFLINQCQIITFLILKYDIIENSRIELRGTVLPVQVGGLLGGPKGMLAPPLKLLGGPAPPPPPPPPPPLPTPMFYVVFLQRQGLLITIIQFYIFQKLTTLLPLSKIAAVLMRVIFLLRLKIN